MRGGPGGMKVVADGFPITDLLQPSRSESPTPPPTMWFSWAGTHCCRKGDPFQGPKLGSCLTLGNELSEETHADKARDFIGKGHTGGEQ